MVQHRADGVEFKRVIDTGEEKQLVDAEVEAVG